MITFLYGNHGCGKTEYIYSCLEEDAKNGRKAVLLVPEQTTVTAERELVLRLPASAQLTVEATNFTRLCNRVFRIRGGLSAKYATRGIRLVCMQRALKSVGPLLSEYADAALSDPALPSAMLKICDEFGASGIGTEKMDAAVKKLPEGRTAAKLRDISTVISSYRALLHESFDEPSDDLTRLLNIENPKELFGDMKVYIDSFSGLTGVQHDIIRMLMSSAADVFISVPLPSPTCRSTDTESLRRMSDRLRSDAASSGLRTETVLFDTPKRFRSEALSLIASDLWTPSAPVCKNPDNGSVRIISARDSYDEAEACAAEIRKLIDGGYKFRDIAVVARDATQYRGIIDRAFEDAGICWFLSEKTALSASSPARLILSALKILSGGWQAEDVIAHLKTGLCGFTPEECDLFEIYVEKWRISGRGFTRGPWEMNPDGYTDIITERSARVLEDVNRTRETLCSYLTVLSEEIKTAADCRGICAAIFRFLQTLSVSAQLKAGAKRELATGHVREAVESSHIFKETVSALEDLCSAYSGAPVPDLNEFQKALKTVFDSVTFGTIPVSCDAVTVGSADMLRADSPKCVILLGVYDGSFPAVPAENGLFSSSEREVLGRVLPLMRDRETAASDELYFVRRAAAFASEKLIVFTRIDNTSLAVSRIMRIVPSAETEASDLDVTDRIVSASMACEYSNLLSGTPEAAALEELLASIDAEIPSQLLSESPIDSSELSVASESVLAATGKHTVLTQSRLQCFTDCPFKYYCRYTLGLDPGGKAAFSFSSIGTFVHAILEDFLIEIYTVRGGVFPDNEERRQMLLRIVDEILDRLAPKGSGQRTSRLEHLARRLRFLADVITSDILSELSDSDFVPKAFELKIGKNGIPPLKFRTKDGGTVSLEGVVDRVDVFEKDGKAFVRCVDYKTGSKSFSLSDVDKGENLQLLLYLFSLTRGSSPLPGVSVESEKNEGALTYLSTAAPRVEKNTDDEAGIFESVAQSLSRSGAMLDNEDIRAAVSRSSDDRILMGKEGKRTLITPEGFDVLFSKVSEILVSRAEQIKKGSAAAVPSKGSDSCRYCDFAEVCRTAFRG